MSDQTSIEWCDRTWNPVTGCTKVSAGCDHCYAETMHERFHGKGSFATVTTHPDRLAAPLSWRKPSLVFVNSMSDLFHDDIPTEFIARVWATMALAPQHTFQVLTKRHGRMRSLLNSDTFTARVSDIAYLMAMGEDPTLPRTAAETARLTYLGWESAFPSPSVVGALPWPLPNVWVGVSVEDQRWADIRIPALLGTPAAVRWISAEPLLGPIDLRFVDVVESCTCGGMPYGHERGCGTEPGPHWGLDWVVAGGESGPGARPMHPNWARSLRDRCAEAGVPFLFKQRGAWTWSEPGRFRMPSAPLSDRVGVMHPAGMVALTKSNPFDPFGRGHPHWETRIERVGKRAAGRELDGRIHDGYPEVRS